MAKEKFDWLKMFIASIILSVTILLYNIFVSLSQGASISFAVVLSSVGQGILLGSLSLYLAHLITKKDIALTNVGFSVLAILSYIVFNVLSLIVMINMNFVFIVPISIVSAVQMLFTLWIVDYIKK